LAQGISYVYHAVAVAWNANKRELWVCCGPIHSKARQARPVNAMRGAIIEANVARSKFAKDIHHAAFKHCITPVVLEGTDDPLSAREQAHGRISAWSPNFGLFSLAMFLAEGLCSTPCAPTGSLERSSGNKNWVCNSKRRATCPATSHLTIQLDTWLAFQHLCRIASHLDGSISDHSPRCFVSEKLSLGDLSRTAGNYQHFYISRVPCTVVVLWWWRWRR